MLRNNDNITRLVKFKLYFYPIQIAQFFNFLVRTAAAIAYGLDKKLDEKNILVFDLGEGTLEWVFTTNINLYIEYSNFDYNIVAPISIKSTINVT